MSLTEWKRLPHPLFYLGISVKKPQTSYLATWFFFSLAPLLLPSCSSSHRLRLQRKWYFGRQSAVWGEQHQVLLDLLDSGWVKAGGTCSRRAAPCACSWKRSGGECDCRLDRLTLSVIALTCSYAPMSSWFPLHVREDCLPLASLLPAAKLQSRLWREQASVPPLLPVGWAQAKQKQEKRRWSRKLGR